MSEDWPVTNYDGELKLSGDDDWYSIEKVTFTGTAGLRRSATLPGVLSLYVPSRVADADVEGPGHEMLALARAILAGEAFSAKRCAVSEPKDGRVEFWSPRNSTGAGSVPVERAQDLARAIEEQLG